MSPSLPRLDLAGLCPMGVFELEGLQGDPQNLAELKRSIKRKVGSVSRETRGKVLHEAGRRAELCNSKGVFRARALAVE